MLVFEILQDYRIHGSFLRFFFACFKWCNEPSGSACFSGPWRGFSMDTGAQVEVAKVIPILQRVSQRFGPK